MDWGDGRIAAHIGFLIFLKFLHILFCEGVGGGDRSIAAHFEFFKLLHILFFLGAGGRGDKGITAHF